MAIPAVARHSGDGRGLKQVIELMLRLAMDVARHSGDGRGLKRAIGTGEWHFVVARHSGDGRGLKPAIRQPERLTICSPVTPVTGVD